MGNLTCLIDRDDREYFVFMNKKWLLPTIENVDCLTESGYVEILLTDNITVLGGDTYDMRLLNDTTIRLYQPAYFGGRYHHIPIKKVKGIRRF